MLFLKVLREGNGPLRIETAMPKTAVQTDPAGNDMDVIEIRVVMPDHDILVIDKTHPLHEVSNDPGPLLRVQVLALRQGQAGVPNGTGYAGTGLPRKRELGGQCPGVRPRHVAADDFASVAAPFAQAVIRPSRYTTLLC